MSEHEFELVLEGADLTREELVRQLYAAGLEDATLSSSGGQVVVSVARDADTFADALISAIQEAESVPGVRVLKVAPDELVNAADIAHRTGRTRSSIAMLVSGERGKGDFPPPALHHSRGNPLWRWSEVEAWFADREGRPIDRHRTALVTAVNAALEARRAQADLEASERRRLADLLAS
jgi:predicted DNA-binding transcriptional regulator AlpA